MDDFEKELIAESLEEIDNNLLKMSNILTVIEIENISERDIQEIFRIVHTIKGNTKAIDLNKIATTVHCFEDLLIHLRNKKIIYSLPIHDTCLEFCDRMNDAILLLKSDFSNESNLIDFENKVNIVMNESLNPKEDMEPKENREVVAQKIRPKNVSKIKVLIAEDDELIRDIIAIAIEELPIEGIEVELVNNGLDAFKKLYKNKFDFFITDLNMPKMDGESLVELWRYKIYPKQCPNLLIITGDEHTINELSLNDEGLYTLIKPFSTDRLNKLLKLILGTIKLKNNI
jgi:chemotaxis protein histidine kinase CheA